MVRPFTHDLYAPLAHKAGIGPGDGESLPPGIEYTWLDYVDGRRLAAYRILAAYRDNVARFYLPDQMWQRDPGRGTELERIRQMLADSDQVAPAEKYREYGDAGLLVQQGRSLMLGDTQELLLPELAEALDALEDDAEPDAATVRLQRFDEWLRAWADAERLQLALLEAEENTVGDGDGVYALGWNERLGRPRLRVYDPGWYFPDLATISDDEEYPAVVHVAWDEDRGGETWLHRKTWRLVAVRDDDPLAPEAPYRVPWSDDLVDRVCVYEVAEWKVKNLPNGATVYDLPEPTNVLEAPRALGVDFLPVVHVPNDAAGARHFGRSLLLLVSQLLDDIASTDTDLQANSELVGSTPMVTTGVGAFQPAAGPGAVNNLPAGADAKFLDTSRALTGLVAYDEHLLERLSVNTRLAAALLGRIKPNEVPSGYALELGFAPTRSLIREMRLVRDAKYPLILKFAMRLAQVNGQGDDRLPGGPTPRAEIVLGGFLPADRAAAAKNVAELLGVHAISTQTAVQMLMEADFPIEDAQAEVERIMAERFDDAVKLADATGDDAAVRAMLGLEPRPAPGVPPADGGAA